MSDQSTPTEPQERPPCEQRSLLLQRVATELGMSVEQFREADHRRLIEECLDAFKAQLDRDE